MDNTKNKDAVISRTSKGNTILKNFDTAAVEKVKASEVKVGDFLVRTKNSLAVKLIDIKKDFDETANEDAYTFYWDRAGGNFYTTASELVSIVRKDVAYKKYGNGLKECSELEEAIASEHDLVAKLVPLSETQIFSFMQSLRGGTYFNMGMYSSIPVSRAYKASYRIYKVINMTAIVSGISYENVGTTKDFRDRTSKAAGHAWYDHVPGYENKVGVKKSDPNSKYVLWDIKESSGNWVRYFLVDIATGKVDPISKDAVISSGYLTESEKAKLMPKKVEGYDKSTGALIENQTNWRTAKFENIFWLSQAGANAREYGTKFVESAKVIRSKRLNEDREFNLFRDAHARVTTDLDAILSGGIEEALETAEAAKEVDTKENKPADVVEAKNNEKVSAVKDATKTKANMTESYRRITSRGASLNDNPLFVDFD